MGQATTTAGSSPGRAGESQYVKRLVLAFSSSLLNLCTAAALSSFKSSFDSAVSFARWTATSGFRFLLQFWYTKEPIYWLPQGWLPYYVEWLLAFPRAPMGGISIQVWWIACASMIQLLGDVLIGLYAWLAGSNEQTGKKETRRNFARQKKEL